MRAAIPLLALTALAACGGPEGTKQQGPAFEKVLPGSASDAMLPYDTASSAPPLAPETYEPLEDEAASGARPARSAASEKDVAPAAEPT